VTRALRTALALVFAVPAASASPQAPSPAERVFRPVEKGLLSIEFEIAPPSLARNRLYGNYCVRYAFEAPEKEAISASTEYSDLAPAADSIARNHAWLSLVAGPQWLAAAAAESGAEPAEIGSSFMWKIDAKPDSRVPAGTYTLTFGTSLGNVEPPAPPGLAFRIVPTDEELRAAGVDLEAETKRRVETDGENAEKGRAYDGPWGGAFGWVYAAPPRSDGVYVKRSEAEGVAPARVEKYRRVEDGTGRPALSAVLAREDGERLRELTARNAGKRLAVLSGGFLVAAPAIRDAIGGEIQIVGASNEETKALLARFVGAEKESAEKDPNAPLLLHRAESSKLGVVEIEYDEGPGGLFVVKRLTLHHPGSALGRHTLELLGRKVNQPVDPALFEKKTD